MRFIDTPLYGQQIMIILFILAFILSIFDTIMAIKICKKRWTIFLAIFTLLLSL